MNITGPMSDPDSRTLHPFYDLPGEFTMTHSDRTIQESQNSEREFRTYLQDGRHGQENVEGTNMVETERHAAHTLKNCSRNNDGQAAGRPSQLNLTSTSHVQAPIPSAEYLQRNTNTTCNHHQSPRVDIPSSQIELRHSQLQANDRCELLRFISPTSPLGKLPQEWIFLLLQKARLEAYSDSELRAVLMAQNAAVRIQAMEQNEGSVLTKIDQDTEQTELSTLSTEQLDIQKSVQTAAQEPARKARRTQIWKHAKPSDTVMYSKRPVPPKEQVRGIPPTGNQHHVNTLAVKFLQEAKLNHQPVTAHLNKRPAAAFQGNFAVGEGMALQSCTTQPLVQTKDDMTSPRTTMSEVLQMNGLDVPQLATNPLFSDTPNGNRLINKYGVKLRFSKNGHASKYCHVCGRSASITPVLKCANLLVGLCQKVVCEKCSRRYDSQYSSCREGSLCIHCRGKCPNIARCVQYMRNNAKRRSRNLERKLQKQEKQEDQGGGEQECKSDVNDEDRDDESGISLTGVSDPNAF